MFSKRTKVQSIGNDCALSSGIVYICEKGTNSVFKVRDGPGSKLSHCSEYIPTILRITFAVEYTLFVGPSSMLYVCHTPSHGFTEA